MVRVTSGDGTINDDAHRLIEQAARSFGNELHTPAYHEVHSDSDHLGWMVSQLCSAGARSLLDLGTGNGYVALAAATRAPAARVTGVDIATGAIATNRQVAAGRELSNLDFQVSNGITLPFPSDSFDGVSSRYAFHHFPRLEQTLAEVCRVLRPGGRFVLADAVRDRRDDVDFLNDFQVLKGDGHVEMLTREALIQLVRRHGFESTGERESVLSFDRLSNPEYDTLIDKTPLHALEAYQLARDGGTISLTIPIYSAVFVRQTGP